MTTSVSTKVRTIGGASMLALSASLTGTALAQMAPAPLVAAPTPTAPTPPANAAECVVVSGTVVCPPGTDPDGFFDLSDNPLGLDIQDGAVVQGPVIITGAVTGAVDGSIQTSADGDGGLATGAGSDVTIGGFIQTDGQFSVAVEAGDGSSVVNDGTIYTTGDNFSDAVSLGADSSFTNNGLVQTDGAESFGVFGPASGINVTNSVTGSIITSGTGSAAVGLLDNAVVNNAGLVQTFGDFSVGIDTQESGSVTNSGNIATAGEESFGIGVRDGSNVTNSGSITTSGEIAHGISAITNTTIVNTGSITTSGDFASGVSGLANTNLTNSGTIATSGVLADAVSVRGGSVVENSGTISTSGDEAIAVFGFGNNVSITNTAAGNITTDGLAGFGIVVLDGATVVNDGAIATTGEFGIAIDTQEASDVTNNGSINTAGDEGVGIGVRSDSTVTNTGSINTAGTEAHGIVALNTATIVNSGSVDTTGDTAFGIRALADAQITNSGDVATAGAGSRALSVTSGATVNNSGTLSTSGDGSFALGATDGLTLVNSGSIETTGNSRAIDARDGATITNEAGGTISAAGASGTIRAGANLVLVINIIDDDLLVDYVPVIGSLAVQVNAVNPLANATDPNVAAFGLGLTGGLNAGTLSQANFDLVNNLPDFDAYQALALDALPNLNEGAGREIFESSSAASDALNRHLLSDESGVWGEFILRGADQDGFSASQGGYESSQTIFTVGGDFVFGEMGQIGVLASYADIENDDLGANGALRGQTDIESIKLGVYVATSFAERGFLNGEVAYLTGEIESTRAGALGTINSAQDFDGFAYSAVAGFDLLPDENVSLTPSVGINGATISFDDAVEAGGFGFTVARDDAEFFELRGAVEFGAQVSDKVDGFVRGTIIHDLSDDQRLVTLSSAQLTPFTTVLPLREQDRFELAAGASVDVTQNVSFELGYLGDFADGYDAHSAHVTARIAF